MNSKSALPFEDILTAARRGCLQSRGELFERYRKLFKMLVRIRIDSPLRAKLDASDIVQDTFVRAHQAFGQFQGESERQLVAWLRSILASRLVQGDSDRHRP